LPDRTTDGAPLHVGVLFFGLARDLRATIGSIRAMVREPNAAPAVRLGVFASLNLVDRVVSPRANEHGVPVDPAQVFELQADAYELVRQDDSTIAGPLAEAMRQRDHFDNDWTSVRNLLHQLTSLRRGWRLMRRAQAQAPGPRFSHYLFLRPDLEYLDPIRIAEIVARFPGTGSLAIPDWHAWGGLNDRIALADAAAAEVYAERIALIPDFVAQRPLQGERLLDFAVARARLKVGALPVRARRVRADGRATEEDFEAKRRNLPAVPALLPPMPPRPPRPLPAPDPEARLRRRMVDGFARTAALTGMPYLKFLGALHNSGLVRRYLEIGTRNGRSLELARGRAISIDPSYRLDKAAWDAREGFHLFETTSDDFFATHDARGLLGGPLDLGFIDGMHLADHVLRDVINVERASAPSGMIAIHDVIPGNFEMARRDGRAELRRDTALAQAWTGDVWRVLPLLRRERPDLRIEVLDCRPTGLALVTGLDPGSQVLARRLDALTEELIATEPDEAAFWDFIGTVPLARSEVVLSRLLSPKA
jgi:hypothetical protein